MIFNPIILHMRDATPPDEPPVRRSVWWACVVIFLIGIVAGRYSIGIN